LLVGLLLTENLTCLLLFQYSTGKNKWLFRLWAKSRSVCISRRQHYCFASLLLQYFLHLLRSLLYSALFYYRSI